MLIFKKKHHPRPDYSLLGTDLHSHLLPGIDDGAPDLETSLSLIQGLRELGFERLITTPHVMGDMYPNTPEIISERLLAVHMGLAETSATADLQAAAEYFLDDQMADYMQDSKPMLTISGKYLLCEFSMMSPTMGLKEMIFQLQMQGYQILLAHPERYVYLEMNKGHYDELKAMGCLFQLNLLSLGSYYGKTVQSLTQYLIKKQYYDFAATDLHNVRQLELLQDPKLGEGLKRLMDSGRIRNRELMS